MTTEIKTQKELKDLFNTLHDQGFGFSWAQHEREALRSKIDKLCAKHNTLQLDCDPSQLRRDLDLDQYNAFAKMEEALKKHFATFGKPDLIKECLQHCGVPLSCEPIHIWKSDTQEQKNKQLDKLTGYQISKEKDTDGNPPTVFYLHDLTGNTLKINVHSSNQNQFSKLMILFFPDVKDLDVWAAGNYKADFLDNRPSLNRQGPKCEFGQWYCCGGLMQLRFFKNGSVEIKHPKLMELKYAYKDYYLTRFGNAVKI